jgi:hypothetical protein
MSRFITASSGVMIIALILLFACKSKKVKTVQDEDLSASEFISLVPKVSFPVIIHDTMLNKKPNDSALINQAVFKTFIPDSVFKKYYPQTKQLKLYLAGKVSDGAEGSYIMIKSILPSSRAAHVFYFDKSASYKGSMKLADANQKAKGNRYTKIDSRLNITMVDEAKLSTGELQVAETVYYLDEDGSFKIAMTNSNEDLSDEVMGNPIDTFPRKNKFSADYSNDKKNFISIRDDTSAKSFYFYIHFSKQNGECTGEVKGKGTWVDKTKGVFNDESSDCVILLNFTSSSVSIKEEDGCGSYRGITCFFEGTYARNKEAVKPKDKSKTKKK